MTPVIVLCHIGIGTGALGSSVHVQTRNSNSSPAMELRLVVTEAAAEASLEAMVIPTSAAAMAAKSLMPSPQYMQVLCRPCMDIIQVFVTVKGRQSRHANIQAHACLVQPLHAHAECVHAS